MNHTACDCCGRTGVGEDEIMCWRCKPPPRGGPPRTGWVYEDGYSVRVFVSSDPSERCGTGFPFLSGGWELAREWARACNIELKPVAEPMSAYDQRMLDEVEVEIAARRARLERIRAIIHANSIAGRATYEGLESSEIGEHSRSLMFGDFDEAFPSREEWSRIVD